MRVNATLAAIADARRRFGLWGSVLAAVALVSRPQIRSFEYPVHSGTHIHHALPSVVIPPTSWHSIRFCC